MRELLEGPNLHRLLIAGGLFLAQQSTGSTALAYFGPQFFSLLVGPGDKNLLLTGIFGAIKVAACLFFVIFMSDRFGRRPLLAAGTAFMAVCMLATAGLVKNYPPENGVVTSAGIATVALIYLDIIAYNLSYGPLPWPIASGKLDNTYPHKCPSTHHNSHTNQSHRNLPNPHPRTRRRLRRRLAMALQFHLELRNPLHNGRHRLGHLPALRDPRHPHSGIHDFLSQGDGRKNAGGDQ